MVETREVYKKYRATVEGVMDELLLPYEIKNYLHDKLSISQIVAMRANKDQQTTDVEIEIQTGRKHQIRHHLSGMGYPILRDRLYGENASNLDLQLSSVNIKFKCPVSGEIRDYKI